ncbi:hypothetical protein FQZ97_956850 [compost metagenome]
MLLVGVATATTLARLRLGGERGASISLTPILVIVGNRGSAPGMTVWAATMKVGCVGQSDTSLRLNVRTGKQGLSWRLIWPGNANTKSIGTTDANRQQKVLKIWGDRPRPCSQERPSPGQGALLACPWRRLPARRSCGTHEGHHLLLVALEAATSQQDKRGRFKTGPV